MESAGVALAQTQVTLDASTVVMPSGQAPRVSATDHPWDLAQLVKAAS